jgi:hypothetical protein
VQCHPLLLYKPVVVGVVDDPDIVTQVTSGINFKDGESKS